MKNIDTTWFSLNFQFIEVGQKTRVPDFKKFRECYGS